jgi:hypothetical protein
MTNGDRADRRGSIEEISSRIERDAVDAAGSGNEELKNTFVAPRERFELGCALDDEGDGWSEESRGSEAELVDESSSADASSWFGSREASDEDPGLTKFDC